VKILLADDHPLFLDGLRNLLTAHGFEVVGTARDGLEALEQARKARPDLVLMDIDMPRVDGLAATRLIMAEMADTKIVVLTMSADDENLFDAIKSGACGYLLKSQETDEFFAHLTDAARGEIVLSPGLADRIVQEFARERGSAPGLSRPGPSEALSMRQRQVLTLVAQGLSYKEVGAKLHLTERTIKYHMGEIVQRLQMDNRAQVIEYARRTGLIR
jgi:two-component system NarL family response regulator